jgi:phosphoribosylaminoimidazole-succinocarboxamide synthase
MDREIRADAHSVLPDATIPELPGHYRGKVRDNYDLPDGRRIIVASDRISAFDRILGAIPWKGMVLTQTARFWFEATRDICPNHVVSYPDPNVVVARRLDILPVEVVVRGYLAGTTSTSILTMYKAGARRMYGHDFPDGLRDNERLPAPILTPTTKAFDGGHDEPLTPDEILSRGLLTAAQWDELGRHALALFARGQEVGAARGLILADTKYEIHTPDSSRWWFAGSYPARLAAGQRPESFDKDFMRSWVAARCDPYRDEIPPIPEEVVVATARVYIDAFERITGERFAIPAGGEAPLARIRRALAPFFPGAAPTAG